MLGLMQQQPLLISSLLTFAARHHGEAEIVSNTLEGPRHRYTYRDAERRARRLARVLEGLGVRTGDRVGTLAWNGYRHYELYFAVSGMGAVIHTINPRLFEVQIAYIVDHAEDRVLFVDLTFVPLVERLLGQLHHRPADVVVMTDRAHLPAASLPPGVALHAYEDLLAAADDDFAWPEFDENTAAALCYTSGTTGQPKGVLYSHRSTVQVAFWPRNSLTTSHPIVPPTCATSTSPTPSGPFLSTSSRPTCRPRSSTLSSRPWWLHSRVSGSSRRSGPRAF